MLTIRTRILLCSALLLWGCGHPTAPTASAPAGLVVLTPTQVQQLNLQLDSLHHRALRRSITLNGKVVVLSDRQAHISSPLPATIQQIHVREGAPVAQGALLFTLSSMAYVQLQQDYLEAHSQAQLALQEWQRQQTLLQEKVGAEAELQRAAATQQATAARVAALAAKLRLCGTNPETLLQSGQVATHLQLYAPIGGFIIRLPAVLGMRTDGNSELLHLYNLDDPHADLFVYEKDVNALQVHQRIQLEFTGAGLPPAEGRIEYISRTVEGNDRSVVVHVEFTPPAGKLVLPEMSVRAQVPTQEQTARLPSLPQTALQGDEGEHYVYYQTGPDSTGRLLHHRLAVQVLHTQDGWVQLQLLQQAPAHARYVVRGAHLLRAQAERGSED